MNTRTEPRITIKVAATPGEIDNPMQERHIGEVAVSVEETAEAVFTASRLEAQKEAGSLFVP